MIDLPCTDNYFELFQLPLQFAIDPSQLSRAYRELQRVVHPDRFVNASAHERCLAQQKATLVNDGYRILRDDLCRARHLLQLKHVECQQHTLNDTEFLMTQMQLREELEMIAANQDLGQLGALLTHVQQQQQACKDRLQALFSAKDDLQPACDEVIKLQFLNKLYEEAASLEERLT